MLVATITGRGRDVREAVVDQIKHGSMYICNVPYVTFKFECDAPLSYSGTVWLSVQVGTEVPMKDIYVPTYMYPIHITLK